MIMSSELQAQKQEMETQEGAERTRATRVYIPRVDILSGENEIIIYAELPGVEEQNVDITVEKDVLTINGYVSTAVHAPEGYELAHSEYEAGDFQRSFTLPAEINRDGIEASLSNGVLRLALPKAPEAQARKITVKAG
jgi:HSP20 family molecular chaperone IbpA